MRVFLFISVLFFITCKDKPQRTLSIDKNTIDSVEIRKQYDSVSLRLSNSQVDSVLIQFQHTVEQHISKGSEQYHITFFFKDGRHVDYKINENYIRALGGYTFRITDKRFFEKLWLVQAGLTDKHIEYFPTYIFSKDTAQQVKRLDAAHLEGIKKVLTYHNHQWAEAHGYVFYLDTLSIKTLFDYTQKAEDRIWLSNIQ